MNASDFKYGTKDLNPEHGDSNTWDKTEETIQESEEKYRYLFSNHPQAMFIYDLETLSFLEINTAAITQYGYSKEEFLQMTLKDIRPVEDIPELLKDIEQTRRAYNPGGEWRHKRKNGELINVQISSHSVIFNGRNARHVLVTDITSRKKAELALKESENKYRSLVENSPDAIVIHLDGKIAFANKECVRLTGLSSQDELVGRSAMQFVHPDYRQLVIDRIRKIENEGVTLPPLVEKFLLPDGTEIDAEVHAMPVLFENKPAVQLIIRDISLRNQAMQAIKESRENLRALNDLYSEMLQLEDLDSIYNYISRKLSERFPDTIILCGSINPDGNESQLESIDGIDNVLLKKILKITRFNPLKKKFPFVQDRHDYMITASFVEFKNGFTEFSSPELPAFAARAIKKLIGLNKIYAIGIIRDKHLLATIHFLTFNNSIIKDGAFIETFVNQVALVLEKKLALIELEKSEAKLSKLNTDKDLLMSVLAHDLKGPFNSLLGFSELLNKNIHKFDKDKIENIAGTIHKSAQRAYNLLENLLTWVRSQSGKVPFEPQKLDFTLVCMNTLRDIKLMADGKNLTINCTVPKKLEIFADVYMLETILRNLVSNAIKFSRTGGQISVKAEQNRKNTTITISDKGVGIPPEALVKLFDVSELHSTKGTSNETGTGLGLLICREFIEIHGGKIRVESEPGKGSNFIFTLPLSV